MVTTKSLDLPTKVTKRCTKQEKEKHKRNQARERKIDRLIGAYPNVSDDQIQEWVNDDEELIQSFKDEQVEFCNNLSSLVNMDIKVTGSRWYHSDRRIGRIWKSIHERNIRNNTTTILIFRYNDQNVYRLSVGAGKEDGMVSQAISKGYTLSTIKVNYQDVV